MPPTFQTLCKDKIQCTAPTGWSQQSLKERMSQGSFQSPSALSRTTTTQVAPPPNFVVFFSLLLLLSLCPCPTPNFVRWPLGECPPSSAPCPLLLFWEHEWQECGIILYGWISKNLKIWTRRAICEAQSPLEGEVEWVLGPQN